MDLKVNIEQLDHVALAVRLLPLVGDKLRQHENPALCLLSNASRLPPSLLRSTLGRLPQETQDELTAFLVNSYAEPLKAALTALGQKEGIDFKITGLELKP